MNKWLEKSRDERPGSLRTLRIKFTNHKHNFRSYYYATATSKSEAILNGSRWGIVTEVRLLKKETELDRLWEINSEAYNKFWNKNIDGVELIDILNRYSIYRGDKVDKKISKYGKIHGEELYRPRPSSNQSNNRYG